MYHFLFDFFIPDLKSASFYFGGFLENKYMCCRASKYM